MNGMSVRSVADRCLLRSVWTFVAVFAASVFGQTQSQSPQPPLFCPAGLLTPQQQSAAFPGPPYAFTPPPLTADNALPLFAPISTAPPPEQFERVTHPFPVAHINPPTAAIIQTNKFW